MEGWYWLQKWTWKLEKTVVGNDVAERERERCQTHSEFQLHSQKRWNWQTICLQNITGNGETYLPENKSSVI